MRVENVGFDITQYRTIIVILESIATLTQSTA